MMTRDRAGLRVLPLDECLDLLAGRLPRIGRVAFPDDERVTVLPVNYRVDQGDIVFRTSADSALGHMPAGQDVAFQVDDVDVNWAEGWSVLVKGSLEPVDDAAELERLRRLPLHPWAPGDRSRYLRIRPDEVTGRRIE